MVNIFMILIPIYIQIWGSLDQENDVLGLPLKLIQNGEIIPVN